jgi:hypothetical protein
MTRTKNKIESRTIFKPGLKKNPVISASKRKHVAAAEVEDILSQLHTSITN